MRPSRRIRARRRDKQRGGAEWDERVADTRAMDELVRQLEKEHFEEELVEAMEGMTPQGCVVKYRLGRGLRRRREGATEYALDPADVWQGRLVVVNTADVMSGRRHFRVAYPDSWMQEDTRREREQKALRGLHDYGKEFVEYKGVWYEALLERQESEESEIEVEKEKGQGKQGKWLTEG